MSHKQRKQRQRHGKSQVSPRARHNRARAALGNDRKAADPLPFKTVQEAFN